MIELKKHIYDESNGLWYELVGDYYIPQLTLPAETQRPVGKWGRMHRDYLKENHPAQYADLILHGNMAAYLADLNEQAQAAHGWETPLAPSWPQLRSCLAFAPRPQASLGRA